MTNYEVVERPDPSARGWRTGLCAALRETAITGKAIRVSLDRYTSLRGITTHLKREGLQAYTRKRGDVVIAWAERIADEPSNGVAQ